MNLEESTNLRKSSSKGSNGDIWSVGRRKTAVARVRMLPSKDGGKVLVNGKPLNEFFHGLDKHSSRAIEPLTAIKGLSGYEFHIKVVGGGITGQADSIRHGIARALSIWDAKIKLQMRKEGFLTRDPRAVERKKPGQPGARKRYQYSKR